MTDTFAQAYLPEAELFAIYALLIAVMIFRPQGLMGNKELSLKIFRKKEAEKK